MVIFFSSIYNRLHMSFHTYVYAHFLLFKPDCVVFLLRYHIMISSGFYYCSKQLDGNKFMVVNIGDLIVIDYHNEKQKEILQHRNHRLLDISNGALYVRLQFYAIYRQSDETVPNCPTQSRNQSL